MKVTERNQVVAPGKVESGESWTDLRQQRVLHPQQSLQMPVGEDAAGPADSFGRLAPAGSTDVHNTTGGAAKGFQKYPLAAHDDSYTGEHTDAFYDDVGGFCERNNYLDRS